MNDSISILVAVFFILIAIRWMLGGNQPNPQGNQPRPTIGRRQHRVTPQMVDTVHGMFPDIPIAAIQADLQRTGSVETTVENALRDGGLPIPANAIPQQTSSNNTNNNTNSNRKSPSHSNLVQRYKIDVQKEETAEPPKVWENSPDKRQEMLRKRKEFMVLQARKKLMEQQQQAEAEKDKSFDDMSVEELNSLSPEQRRDQMLQALQKRSS